MTTSEERNELRPGDLVYYVTDWQKRIKQGQDAVLPIHVHFVHGKWAKLFGKSRLLGKDFYLDRGVAFHAFRALVVRAQKTLETQTERRREELSHYLKLEEKRLEAAR